MELTAIVPMLSVADLEQTIAFYRDALGFRVADTFAYDGKTVWACLVHGAEPSSLLGGIAQCEPVRLMFNEVPDSWVETRDREARKFQIYYFYPKDLATLETLHATLRSRGHRVSDLRVTVYGMKEFEMRDPDFYWLWFGAPTDEPATVAIEETPDSV